MPELRRNLISLGSLKDEGYIYKSTNGILKITRGSLVVMKGKRVNGLYILEGEKVALAEASIVKTQESEMHLWHQRMGHISEQRFRQLLKQGSTDKLKTCALPFCEACVFGKQHKINFTTTKHNTKGVLDYIHSDLWGPRRKPTHSGGTIKGNMAKFEV
ncbi:uncharacterized mitochondrial protein AtMg00300-like [Humulus lupulus]|uniref:uncharacterized mitochondrial protein AtMg00300-like n=1 Tax=Humulus lupulus TaxID=3486 RepID=UPI002B404315|nr:uncharacterized mitochondrial protein AtMg00300-like [Humulus lupulus]